jgi:transketolase
VTRKGTDTRSLARAIRRDSLVQIHRARSGHPGGCLSCADVLAVLYGGALGDQDRLVLSKGHAAPALYAAWANTGRLDRGELDGFRRIGRALQGHPSVAHTPECQTSTGSLGQGLSVALGMALGLRLAGRPGRVFALLGDGELQAGIVWEVAMAAAHHGAANLLAIVDRNGLQSDAATEEILALEPLAERWRAFGWDVQELDGHDHDALAAALAAPRARPACVIARTVKGKGVGYMEDAPAWHGSVTLRDDEFAAALEEIG